MDNKQVVRILNQLADYLDLAGENSFKVSAYRKAGRAVEASRYAIADHLDRLLELPGVGKGTAGVIVEIVETGHSSQLERLRNELPQGLPDLLSLQGVGPKTIYTLYKELGITSRDELLQAAELGRIRVLTGFGAKKEQKILEAVKNFTQLSERVLRVHALQVARVIERELTTLSFIQKMSVAGSLRRGKETVKDLDFVIATTHPEEVADQIVQLPFVQEVVNKGSTKVSVVVDVEGIQISVDFRLVTREQYASALHHFTGSAEHNIRIRQRAKQMGYKVSEYGIYHDDAEEMITFKEEKDFFAHLKLAYVPPELREDRGEMEAAEQDQVPALLQQDDYRGDLHMHSRYSDGAHSIREMAEAAKERGYEYIAITDHSQSLQVANGLTIAELREQWEEIAQVNREVEGITVLRGTEMDILPDGRLDFPDEVLAELDVVIASIHSGMKQDRDTLTRRLIEAMENPYVHIIGHPTGRVLFKRDAYDLDFDHIFQTAKDTGTILECNANGRRLDLNDELLKKAKDEYGLTFSINTDAHSVPDLSRVELGISTAKRAWLTKPDVINTMGLDELQEWLQEKRKMRKEID
ncbi:DNA polymerase (family 10) [Croceifilum oryzae]|uniref:DNA polymerase beta n=1 Tax=Croceifilum oryzae TaxID=1553429 RepID=A0AAJ1WRY5_9BACL|nr:DNA polymerase/3'-5' exonuclease PolX [Croceifilum oryzae]MDQ0417085.1 DNA polymerase (family 10) [Croceifilum oryzae]